MDKYAIEMMKHLKIPQDAQELFVNISDKLKDNADYKKARCEYMNYVDSEENIEVFCKSIENIAGEIAEHYYSVGFVFMLESLGEVHNRYLEIGAGEEIYLATIMDLKYKFDECLINHGVYGTFVLWWFRRLLRASIFIIGKFNYETVGFRYDRYEKDGVVIKKDDTVLNVHIPPGGGMDKENRLDSYNRAEKFYKEVLKIKPKAFVCSSWLLSSVNREILPPKSNIVSFINDFDIVEEKEYDGIPFGWRIFGKASELPPGEWPEDTTLRKGYKEWILDGKRATYAYGVRTIK